MLHFAVKKEILSVNDSFVMYFLLWRLTARLPHAFAVAARVQPGSCIC